MNSERGEDEQQETHEDHAGHEEDSGEEAPCAVTKLTYREKERDRESHIIKCSSVSFT